MRLLARQQTTIEKPAKHSTKPPVSVPAPPVKGDGEPVTGKAAGKKDAQPQPVPATSAAAVVDYSRPTNVTELVLDLQRRLIKVEEYQSRRLTATEFAIALEADTHRSLEQWTKDGYVVEACKCTNIRCKGWRMTPIEHHRMAGQSTVAETRNPEVQKSELKDVALPPPTSEQTAKVKASLAKERHEDGFKKMLKQGKIAQKGDTTLIPKDGPINWSHDEHLAFAHAFDMDDLMALEGKPRELQRKLIAALREIGYNILSAPEKKSK